MGWVLILSILSFLKFYRSCRLRRAFHSVAPPAPPPTATHRHPPCVSGADLMHDLDHVVDLPVEVAVLLREVVDQPPRVGPLLGLLLPEEARRGVYALVHHPLQIVDVVVHALVARAGLEAHGLALGEPGDVGGPRLDGVAHVQLEPVVVVLVLLPEAGVGWSGVVGATADEIS